MADTSLPVVGRYIFVHSTPPNINITVHRKPECSILDDGALGTRMKVQVTLFGHHRQANLGAWYLNFGI